MLRVAGVLGIGAFLIWGVQRLGGFEEAVIELIISGRIPQTQVYLNVLQATLISAFLGSLLIFWMRQLITDFTDFSLDYQREQAALAQAPAQTTGDAEQKSTVSLEDELDLLSA